MSKKVSSEDYIKLRKLLSSGHSPIEVSIEVNNNEEKVKITLLSPDNKQKIFKSTEEDVVLFAFSIQNMCDVDGNFSLGEVKNLEEFFNNLQKLYDPDNKKFHEARIKVLRGETTIEYVPHRLLREFLELGKYSNSKSYSLLRDDYFIIKYLHIEQLKQVNDGLLRIRNQNSKKTEIFNLVLDLFRRSFHKDPNFLKNYQLFQKYNIADAMDLLVSANEDLKHSDHQFLLLHKEGGVPAQQGLRYVIDSYASMAETVIKLMNIIRAAIEISDGIEKPELKKGSMGNWEIIKKHELYNVIVEDFDPRIRHGKAHNNFDIDLEKRVINFYEEGRIRKISVTYDIEQFKIMWHRIHILLSALVMAVCVEQSVLTGVVLESPEYKLLLAGLGNFKPLSKNGNRRHGISRRTSTLRRSL